LSDLPAWIIPTISVSASLGAQSRDDASSVATPLEREFSTIAGVDSMTSSNSQGNSQITITFSLERNIDAAAQDIQSAISKASRSLPADMPTPPSFRKVNPADAPVLFLVLSSANLPLSTVTDYADNVLSQRISMISGVAQVQVYGSQKFAVRIQLDPRAMQARNISVDEVSRAISNANVNLPTGTLYGPYQAFTVEANGQLMRARDFEEWRFGGTTARQCACATLARRLTTSRAIEPPRGM
jgi:HAE1 family hydrophobic/amphiphilic exporter-1